MKKLIGYLMLGVGIAALICGVSCAFTFWIVIASIIGVCVTIAWFGAALWLIESRKPLKESPKIYVDNFESDKPMHPDMFNVSAGIKVIK